MVSRRPRTNRHGIAALLQRVDERARDRELPADCSARGATARGAGASQPLFAITDPNGVWTIETVPPGEYVASAAANGFVRIP